MQTSTRSICFVLLFVMPAPLVYGQATGATGNGSAHPNVQPSLAINHIIRLVGAGQELGEVKLFGGNFAPRGWALANGQLLDVEQNEGLFAQIGTLYGGDGRSTFALPDMRGRIIAGEGHGPGLTNRALGAKWGEEAVSLSVNQIPRHEHTTRVGTTGRTGQGQSHSNTQPTLATNYIIALQGVFPSRNNLVADSLFEPMLGAVSHFSGVSPPNGWAFADGQLLPIQDNQALFSILGTTYGGNGETDFALPDLRGRVPVHAGAGPGLQPRGLGQKFGSENSVISVAALPRHSHTIPLLGESTGLTGNGQGHANTQPSLGLNYLIALQGLFPSRNALSLDEGPVAAPSAIEPFIGEVGLFAGNFAPRGWALADGQLLQISQHTALFSILGTTYGGDGRTTFGLPDLRGRAAMHAGNGPGLTSRPLGWKGGADQVALSVSELPRHTHPLFICDLNDDGRVDAADVGSLFENWEQPGATDLNADGTTDAADAGICFSEWTGDNRVTAIPEPALCGWFVVASVGIVRRRRARRS